MRISSTTAAPASDANIAAVFERLAAQAAGLIMEVYGSGPVVGVKSDASPVTEADCASERLILAGLRERFPLVTCVAEEETAAGAVPEALGDTFFLVDPLDGTREFIERRPDFTVNIAMVRDGQPVVGVVLAPARGEMLVGYGGTAEAVRLDRDFAIEDRSPIAVRSRLAPPTIVASRSHRDQQTDLYIRRFDGADIVSVGSSLKFCMVARGNADIYPRFGRTMEWDTAAGDAVLRAAGGMTLTLDGLPLAYGKRGDAARGDFGNPSFIAHGVGGENARCVV